jgi:methyl-accepting chemotaxis protein
MVVRAIDSIATVARQNLTTLETLTSTARNLATQSEQLRRQAADFQT